MKAPQQQPEIFIHPGGFHFGAAPGRVGTLLGSCIAVTLWHPQRRFGGLCHILLPTRKRPPGSLPDCRYANESIERFSYELNSRRVQPGSCLVKLFGGGNMFAGKPGGRLDVGRRNVAATRTALANYGFSVAVEDVGGYAPRRLVLDLSTGHVWMAVPEKRLAQEENH